MKRIIISALTIMLFISCKKEAKIEYKYADNDDILKCTSVDIDLIKEAVYAFEDYAKEYYSFQSPKSVAQGYYYYWGIAKNYRLPAIEFINPHIIKLRDLLKEDKDLWIIKNDETFLNINHPVVTCISKQLIDPELKKLFNLLIDTNTFSTQVFLASLTKGDERVRDDKAFHTYLILDTFYARILDVDFNDLEASLNKNRDKAIKEIQGNNPPNNEEIINENLE